jgi:hypothetical protein
LRTSAQVRRASTMRWAGCQSAADRTRSRSEPSTAHLVNIPSTWPIARSRSVGFGGVEPLGRGKAKLEPSRPQSARVSASWRRLASSMWRPCTPLCLSQHLCPKFPDNKILLCGGTSFNVRSRPLQRRLAPTSSLATRTLSTHYGSINLLDSLHFQCYTRRQRFVQRPMQASLKGVGKMPRAWRAAPAKPC